MKTILIIIAAVVLGYSNDASENMFIMGNAHARQGHDSLACFYYGLAYQNDTSSITLKEILANSLIKMGQKDRALPFLKSVSNYYVSKGDWAGAFESLLQLYVLTKGYHDGSLLALSIYKDGIKTEDSFKIQKADNIWNTLSQRAYSNHDLDSALKIISTKMTAHLQGGLK